MPNREKTKSWLGAIDEFYPKITPILLAIFCVYVFIWFIQIGERRHFFASIRFEFALAAVLIAITMLSQFAHKPISDRSSYLFPYVLSFFTVLVIHVYFSANPDFSWNLFVNRILKFSFMGLFIATFVKSPRHMRYFIFAFLMACFFITQESFRNALNGSMVWYNQGVPRLHGNTSLFAHPNSLAGMAMGTIPFIWFLVPAVKSNITRGFLAGFGLMAAAVVMYCGSRTSYVGFMFFGVYALYASKRRFSFALLVAIAATIGVEYIPEEYKARFMTMFTGEEIEGGSMQARTQILEDAWRIFKEYPFGVGVGAFPKVRMEMFSRWQDTHNLYLEVATNIGLHGFIIFSLVIMKLFRVYGDVRRSLEKQIKQIQTYIKEEDIKESKQPLVFKHLNDLIFIKGVSWAAGGYIFIRLVLGLFGMDLYEIYWWIGLGLATALFAINQGALKATHILLSSSNLVEDSFHEREIGPAQLLPRLLTRGKD